jgi:hypothetical protein
MTEVLKGLANIVLGGKYGLKIFDIRNLHQMKPKSDGSTTE